MLSFSFYFAALLFAQSVPGADKAPSSNRGSIAGIVLVFLAIGASVFFLIRKRIDRGAMGKTKAKLPISTQA